VLQWAWHPKPLPTAVPASGAIAAAQLGMDIVVARPDGYDLDPDDMLAIGHLAQVRGGSLTVTDRLEEAVAGADAVYVKSWGALPYFGRPEEEKAARASLRHWRMTTDLTRATRGGKGIVMHCLPVRRNVEIDDAVLDGPNSVVVDEAENRLHAQRALLAVLLKRK
jgi:N-acetylornithine carbamoyltransferase